MKPAPFRCLAPATLEEAAQTLSRRGDEAKLIAGGQSLGPMLNLRLSVPSLLVDLNTVADLDAGTHLGAAGLVIGAMTRQRDAELSQAVAVGCPLLAEVLGEVAHPAIRNRGTVGGSLAHADPAAEMPTVALAVKARLTVMSVRGARDVSASQFFAGYFSTGLAADEILVRILIPPREPRTGWAWREFSARPGDFATVGVAATITLNEDGEVTEVALAYAGASDVPYPVQGVLEVLRGTSPEERLAEAADMAASLVDPSSDLVASADYRRRLVRTLTHRALAASLARAKGQP